MDVVLVIDVSESMAYGNRPDPSKFGPQDPANPAYCNLDNSCEPFRYVKEMAAQFADAILDLPPGDEMDRLSVVTFANGWEEGDLGTRVKLGWTSDLSVAMGSVAGIPSLKVYDPGVICPFGEWGCPAGPACPENVDDIPAGTCMYYGDPDPAGKYAYYGSTCPRIYDIETLHGEIWTGRPEAVSACTTTNTGGGLRLAGQLFAADPRPEALKVVVLITGGAANATFGVQSDIGSSGTNIVLPPLDPIAFLPNLPLGFCPSGTWVSTGTGDPNRRFCQDGDVDTHHLQADPLYDADDFARDLGRFVACHAVTPSPSCSGIHGQEAILFSVGLGNEILALDADPSVADRKPYGASLLRFLAAIGDDGDANTDPCAAETDYSQSCGNYYYAPAGTALGGIFDLIYSRIIALLTA